MSEDDRLRLPTLPDEEREKIERKILEAAWGPLSKLDYRDDDLTTRAIVIALSESAVSANAAEREAHEQFRNSYNYFFIDTEGIVCSAYAAWCLELGGVEHCSPHNISGHRLAAMFTKLCEALGHVERAVEEIDEEELLSFDGDLAKKRLSTEGES